MDENNEKALVPRPSTAVDKAGSGPNRILSTMVADALAVANREQRMPSTKFRIGDYEWCEPDYKQILIWAKATGLKPEEVIARLLDQQPNFFPFFEEPPFMDGRLLNVKWEDLRLLRCGWQEWVTGLEITRLHFVGASDTAALTPFKVLPLRRLVWLALRRLGLHDLDLNGVAQLEYLDCVECCLEELHLHCVPQLTSLNCSKNNLYELKFDRTPNLQFLVCSANWRLVQLNLSGLNRLKAVFCGDSKLTELGLAGLPTLMSLDCEENRLGELDLTEVPELISLDCSRNLISKLDLNQCPKLWSLLCYQNRLTSLDLASARELKYLDCADNAISELDLSSCPNLVSVDCSGNPIAVLDICGLKHLRWLNVSSHTKVIIDPEQGHIVQDLFSRRPNEPDESKRRVQELIDRFHAAEGGPNERVRFGLACLYGKGASKDPLEAYKWFKLATEQGDKCAAEELTFLASILPSVWLKEGERRYRDFKADPLRRMQK